MTESIAFALHSQVSVPGVKLGLRMDQPNPDAIASFNNGNIYFPFYWRVPPAFSHELQNTRSKSFLSASPTFPEN
jgi:hypothetical protein